MSDWVNIKDKLPEQDMPKLHIGVIGSYFNPVAGYQQNHEHEYLGAFIDGKFMKIDESGNAIIHNFMKKNTVAMFWKECEQYL